MISVYLVSSLPVRSAGHCMVRMFGGKACWDLLTTFNGPELQLVMLGVVGAKLCAFLTE